MASRDPAFLWESEVLRETGAERPDHPQRGNVTMTDDHDWVTLKEASELSGVPAATIRKWARHDNIPTFLEETSEGFLRYVSMRGVRDWSGEIGREIATAPVPDDGAQIDLTTDDEATGAEPHVPEGSMLVPLDAWNRMLNQLGNLHEAGQQLAEARERAAKAETEARFLKERMSELRDELERARSHTLADPAQAAGQAREPEQGLTSLARKAYAGWRKRRRP